MEERVRKVIEERVRPALQMDGGDIEFLGMEGNKVKVRLVGACHGCPSAAYTLQLGVTHMIRSEVPEVEAVVAV